MLIPREHDVLRLLARGPTNAEYVYSATHSAGWVGAATICNGSPAPLGALTGRSAAFWTGPLHPPGCAPSVESQNSLITTRARSSTVHTGGACLPKASPPDNRLARTGVPSCARQSLPPHERFSPPVPPACSG